MASTREDLLSELKHLASEVMEKVERSKNMAKDFDPDHHLSSVRREAKKIAFPNMDYEKSNRQETVNHHEEPPSEQPEIREEQPKKTHESFFDAIG